MITVCDLNLEFILTYLIYLRNNILSFDASYIRANKSFNINPLETSNSCLNAVINY